MEQDRRDPRQAEEHTDTDQAPEQVSGTDQGTGRGFMRHMTGRNGVLTLGLAASSLALLAGRTPTSDTPAGTGAGVDPVAPQAAAADAQKVSWDLHVTDNDRVDFFVEFLMGKNYDKTHLWLERIGKYGPMIQNELRERGMPEDLLYLTMIESGLDPNAYSKADAAGLWQFIEETGERYGLEVNEYVDERRDPVESTGAALEYLGMMNDRFGSWYLSAAGYNSGENRVSRLVKERIGTEKADSEDMYWEIWDKLPRETRDYVPLMLAMGHIAKDPAKYGFRDIKMQEPLQFEEVSVAGGTKLSTVALGAGVNADVLEDLNPHLVKKMTPPGGSYMVRVPVGRSQTVLAALGGSAPGTAASVATDVLTE